LDGPITVEGSLIDDETGDGLENMEITFDGSGAGGLSSVITGENGAFLVEGTAPDTVDKGWEVQAHFAGVSDHAASESNIEIYDTDETTLYQTILELESIPDVPVRESITVEGSLIDDETGDGLENMEITFDGSGAGGLSSATTNEDGKFSALGTAPDTADKGWEVQAHFAGDSEFGAVDSVPASYSTQSLPIDDPKRPTLGSPDVNPGPPDVNQGKPNANSELSVVPEPEPGIASPDDPIPPEQPQPLPTNLLIIAGLAVASMVIAVAVKISKGKKSGKNNLEIVDEVITRGGTEK